MQQVPLVTSTQIFFSVLVPPRRGDIAGTFDSFAFNILVFFFLLYLLNIASPNMVLGLAAFLKVLVGWLVEFCFVLGSCLFVFNVAKEKLLPEIASSFVMVLSQVYSRKSYSNDISTPRYHCSLLGTSNGI